MRTVGMLWLGQNQDSPEIDTDLKSFVCIWETKEKRPVDDLTKAQNDAVLALWNEGVLENVYFDIESVTDVNETTDFVFYVKDLNISEAESICKSLPFFKEEIASYKIFPAGTFWLGLYAENLP